MLTMDYGREVQGGALAHSLPKCYHTHHESNPAGAHDVDLPSLIIGSLLQSFSNQ